jgi:O-antigen ligase
MIWLLIGYMWLFVHRPFEIWPAMATSHLERYYMIVAVICWLASRPTLPARNNLHWYFAAFVAVMLTSWMVTPCGDIGDYTVENYLKFVVFYVMLVSTVRTEQDLRKILVGYLAVMTLWMAHCVREYYNGSATWAQGIKRLVPVGHSYDFNDFAGLIVCSLPFVWVFWREWTGWAMRLLLLAYCGLAGYCIMLSGSRMGVVGVGATVVIGCLASAKRWRLLAILPVFVVAVWMILPQDRRNRYFTLYDPDAGVKTGANLSAGNYRFSGFEASLPLFEDRPLLGYGPMGFLAQKRWMPHNLYGQLLAELGLLGAVAFALIFWGVACNVFEARRIARDFSGGRLARDTVVAIGAAYIILAIMSWGFNFLFWQVWLWFGGFQLVALQLLKVQAAESQEEAFEVEDSWDEAAVEY